MKYRLLPFAFVFIASLPTQAQQVSRAVMRQAEGQEKLQPLDQAELAQSRADAPVRPSKLPQAKTTGTAFYTQTFASLPVGWTVTHNAGSVDGWRWANAAPTGQFNVYAVTGLINSTTKGNGWLLYNADSVLINSGPGRPFGGAITSAAIPVGAAHSSVMLSFQQQYRHSDGDSCFVDVSNDGSTWTSFPIYPNMALTQYGLLYRNPTITTLNISSVVGGQANAYIRFRFNSTAPTYSFNWLIDDLVLYDADPTDLAIGYSGIASASDTNVSFSRSYSYSSIPLRLADSVYPVTYLSNYGLSPVASTVLTARYYMGGNLLSTQTMNTPVTPLYARDSALVFTSGYKPTAVGDYVIALSINPAGDAVTGNNVDTIRFSVTDTVYASYGPEFTDRNCYLNRPSTGSAQYWGARFTISNGQRDTITSVSAAFRPVTVPGERVQAQLYQASGSGTSFSWVPLAVSYTRTLTSADISTASNVVMTTFPLRIVSGNYAPLVLGNGDYAVVLTTVNSVNDVALYAMAPPFPAAPAFVGYQGQSDVSPNDGSQYFAGGGGIATGLVQVPLMHPSFGNARALLAVHDAEPIVLGAAFPNPANTSINIPVALQQNGRAKLLLSNTVGQVVAEKDLGYLGAGIMQLASIYTGQMPEGLYFYTVVGDAGRASGRVTIRH